MLHVLPHSFPTRRSSALLHHHSLPPPGRIRELLSLVSELHAVPLDRARPLWEFHVIEGLEDGRFAIYAKVHHAMVDGVAAMRMLRKALSEEDRKSTRLNSSH